MLFGYHGLCYVGAILAAGPIAMTTASFSRREAERAWPAFAGLLVGGVAVAFASILVRFSEVGFGATGFWRMVFALPALALWARLEPASASASTADGGLRASQAMVLAGVAFAIDMVLYNAALSLTSVANAVILVNLAPLGLVLAAWLSMGERSDRRTLGGLALAFLGACLLVGRGGPGNGGALTGDALAVAAAAAYGAYLFWVKEARTESGSGRVGLVSSAVAALACLVVALLRGETLLPGTTDGWLVLAALGVGCHAFGQGLMTVALGRLPAAVTSLVIFLQPAVTVLAAWLIFAEVPTVMQWIGGVLVMTAVAGVRLKR
ncbi:DMT family transporter [Chelatococcus sp. SYSU_G07232]|uniref:DMT family transporter n=1 Tax=Chelatococcus albus TaxID=3047466 RepID=A0ABT7ALE3_9HYPH|nr:DMT family transporter [Chelatococcus sp. SYSU_G07232]MDJ1160197.1 DMT family transporter [Chelatococcus sp. SYSU_G07232]